MSAGEIALKRGLENLRARQADDGGFEGEVIWCPMLAAQYAIMCHITGTPLGEERRRRLFLQFERTRLSDGLWGLHPHSQSYLFTTALVYVAARLHGVAADDALLQPARAFFEREGGVVRIPSWGKFWLAMLGLYSWEGVNPVLPEAWLLPTWLPLHPSNYYCHTRLIYMGMATIYAQRRQAARTPVLDALRNELYPLGYEKVDFKAARDQLRDEEIFTPPSGSLRLLYRASLLAERLHRKRDRERVLNDLYARIRCELQSTDHTCLSPVNGLLNIIALFLRDAEDPDFKQAIHQFEGWIWEDDVDGLRVAGARSATWDTAFAIQALTAAAPHQDVTDDIQRAASFLQSQQIQTTFHGYREQYRIDPRGGFCFAGVWHGWPVSDCTAEAIEALMKAPQVDVPQARIEDAVQFILRCQNYDGGFGSYESRKSRVGLEWINPAEMFGDSMTEASYVECTASNISALCEFRHHYPNVQRVEVDRAVERAVAFLRRAQRSDGAWSGCWGVHFTYGTMFGIRGLRAAGVASVDPAIQRAADWLVRHQRSDGGWGEHHRTALIDRYVEHRESQFVQTAWALIGLTEAEASQWSAIDRGANFLAQAQLANGEWPQQDMAGVFFHTALLEYSYYRHYFPIWALGLVESRQKARTVAVSKPHGFEEQVHAIHAES